MDTGKVMKLTTILGMACFILMILSCTGLLERMMAPKPEIPEPEPVIEITTAIGRTGEISLYRYYSAKTYPDGPPVTTGGRAEYGGEIYILKYITDGLVSTWEGDCWETVYQKSK